MPDLGTMAERILDWDRLLQPIPGECPSGRSLRNQPAYDAIRDGLRPAGQPPVGVAARDQKGIDFRMVIRDASGMLARDSKDLDVAVWLTEALVGEHGFSALAEGILLIQSLLDTFWPTVFPAIDQDGDEGFRAKPISRLNQAFNGAVLQVQVTSDPRAPSQFALHQYNASREIPSAVKSYNSSDLQTQRDKALAEGIPSPEDVDQAIEGTSLEYYRQSAEDVQRASAAVEQLQQSCNRHFQTEDRPYLEKLSNQLEGLRNTIESLGNSKAPVPAPPQAPQPAPAANAPPQDYSTGHTETYSATAASVATPVAIPVAVPQPTPAGIPALAAVMRQEDSSDPVPYMLLRSWRFGPLIGRGAPVDEQQLVPPPTELRTALRRAVLNTEWWDVLEQTEIAMALECGAFWLDVQFHAHGAATALGKPGIATAIRGMLAAYLQALPDLAGAIMLDGSPTASPQTLAWIRGDVLVDPNQARKESLDEVRGIDLESHREVFEGKPPDPFDVAETELAAGRFAEAFRVLSEAIEAEPNGRGRAQRKVQLAKVCLEAHLYRIALPILREVCRTIEELRLDTWEPREFAAAPLAMLYTCLQKLDECPDERQRAYDRLCSLHPMKAWQLAGEELAGEA